MNCSTPAIESPYGFCPTCGAPGRTRERRPDGNDTCNNGHKYPSRSAIPIQADWSNRLTEFNKYIMTEALGIIAMAQNDAADKARPKLDTILGQPVTYWLRIEEIMQTHGIRNLDELTEFMRHKPKPATVEDIVDFSNHCAEYAIRQQKIEDALKELIVEADAAIESAHINLHMAQTTALRLQIQERISNITLRRDRYAALVEGA